MAEENLSMQELLRLGEKVKEWNEKSEDEDHPGWQISYSGYIKNIKITVSRGCGYGKLSDARPEEYDESDNLFRDSFAIKAMGIYKEKNNAIQIDLNDYTQGEQKEICQLYRSAAIKYLEQKEKMIKKEIDVEAARNKLIKQARNLLK